MADANILDALQRQGRGGCLEKLILYGKVRCAIKRPDILGKNVEVSNVGSFAILDVFSVRCLGDDYFGNNHNGLYFTRGSMIIFINSLDWVGEIVKVSGNSVRSGVKVRQQFNHKTPYDGITALAFQRVNNSFEIGPNYILKLGEKDSDLNMTPMMDFVAKLRAENIEEYPTTLDSIMDFQGVVEYEEVGKDDVVDISDTYHKGDSGERIDISNIKMDLVHHLNGVKESQILGMVKEDIEELKKSRKKFTKDLVKTIGENISKDNDSISNIGNNIEDAFINRVLLRFNQNIGASTIKGKVYAKDFIEAMSGKPFVPEDGFRMPSTKDIVKAKESMLSMIQLDPNMLKGGVLEGTGNEGDIVGLPMMKEWESIIISIISVTTGISMDDFRSNFYTCNMVGNLKLDNWLYVLLNNPYILGIMGSSLNVVACDKIYFSYTKYFTEGKYHKECGDFRADMLYLKTLETVDDKNTLVSVKDLSMAKASYPGLGERFLKQNNFPAKRDYVEVLSCICNANVMLKQSYVTALLEMKWYSKERTDSLIEKGIVNSVDDKVCLEKDMEKEVIIYETLIKKGHEDTGISLKQIEDIINIYQEDQGFKLEDLQVEGVKLCMKRAGVLSGGAGSGKTTTSNCMKAVLEKYLGNYSVVCCTPTGKACRRLAEVVGGTVKTLHSQFGVGLVGEGYLTEIKKKYEDWNNPSHIIYILDEMAMCSTDLLYEVCRNLGKDDIVYFLGDVQQLSPIGKGVPFATLMTILPCVMLGVSKRAAEGSLINYNSTLLNFMSDDVVEELQYDDKSFIKLECPDMEISNSVVKLWKQFSEGEVNGVQYEEDDIQVISGYTASDKLFSSTNINPVLQRYLRSKDKLLFRHGDMEFYKNDRVIHAKLNSYGTQRYIEVEENMFKTVVTLGIMNGEVGKIVGITRTDFTYIEDFHTSDLEDETGLYGHLTDREKKELLKTRTEREDKIRDDINFKNENYYFVKVQVYDTDLQRDVIVFYPARVSSNEEILILGGEDLGNLELAYALTTHKMQGSQSPVVICVYGSNCSPQFINRNMIYVMISRAIDCVAMVGTVEGIESPITKGRRNKCSLKTDDILNLLKDN